MAPLPKLAFYWCSSCGGCEESIFDLAEALLTLPERAEIVFWPAVVDAKYDSLHQLADGEIEATFINGAIRLDHHVEMARMLRRKSRRVVAHGSCAQTGGVVGLGNLYSRLDLLHRSYRELPTINNPDGVLPAAMADPSPKRSGLTGMCKRVSPLSHVIEIDAVIPGCPPVPEQIRDALAAVLKDPIFEKGTVFAERKSLCNTCPRNDTRPERIQIKRFKRMYETLWDTDRCFLTQELICLGPATRGGCGARCIHANMPCRGCFGPLANVIDQGSQSLSFLAALVGSDEEREIRETVDSIPDPAGLFYRYCLAGSILGGRPLDENDE